MSEQLHDKSYPGETSRYRTARNRLLAAELELDEKVQDVARLRRALPQGGLLARDYVFEECVDGRVSQVPLSALFPKGKSTLLLYSYMYSDDMENACPACASIADGFSNITRHIDDRMGLVLVGKSPAVRLAAHASSNRWDSLRVVSSHGNTYNQDYLAEISDGSQIPMANVFVKSAQGIRHFWGSELFYVKRDCHPHHVDQIWPIWHLLDLTPEGRQDWFPKLAY